MDDIEIEERERKIQRDIMANVTHALVEIRKDAGLSIEEAADLLCIPPEKLLKLENKGSAYRIPLNKFMRMVAAYGGHLVIETRTSSYSLEELTTVPPYTWEERDLIALAQKKREQKSKIIRKQEWLNKMAEEWKEDDEKSL